MEAASQTALVFQPRPWLDEATERLAPQYPWPEFVTRGCLERIAKGHGAALAERFFGVLAQEIKMQQPIDHSGRRVAKATAMFMGDLLSWAG